ncbi:hypothetical protein JCM10212_004123 [Sporobolomyces blumeae]
MSTRVRRLSLPTSVLPKLSRNLTNANVSSNRLLSLIDHLRLLYVPSATSSTDPAADALAHPSDEAVERSTFSSEVEEDESVDPLLHQDQFERSWAVNWLGLIVKRGEEWTEEAGGDQDERELRTRIVDEAAALLSHLTATSEGGSILRPLLLPTCLPSASPQTEPLLITLNDALPSHLDPTSVGLQSWGSSIILARMIALDPVKFGVLVPHQRVLELGAGTGLLSLVWKGMSERLDVACDVFATDYHDGVLENLERNVVSNSAAVSPAVSPSGSPYLHPVNPRTSGLSTPAQAATPHTASSRSSTSSASLPVQTHKLDWSAVHSSRQFSAASNPRNPIPTMMPAPFDQPFHTLLAADVVYGPTHATWLKSCVEQFLIKPDAPTEVLESQANLSSEIANLTLDDADSTVHLPTRPSLHTTETSTAVEQSTASHVAATTTSPSPPSTSARRPPSVPVSSPAFHLIVPLRPTHVEAIASITSVFPSRSDLAPREPGESWRVAIQSVTEIERVKGVGRADEASYRLFRIGWC